MRAVGRVGPRLMAVQVDDELARQGRDGSGAGEPGPDVRPLAGIALALAVLSALLAASYFFSILAYPIGGLALLFGLGARGLQRTKWIGTASVVIAALAIGWATLILVLAFRAEA